MSAITGRVRWRWCAIGCGVAGTCDWTSSRSDWEGAGLMFWTRVVQVLFLVPMMVLVGATVRMLWREWKEW